jgi:hypothetical protein
MASTMRKRWSWFGSPASVLRLAKKLGYKRVRMRTLPLLTLRSKQKRASWADSLLKKDHGPFGSEDTVLIHVDEKWFFGLKQRQMFWVAPGEHTPVTNILSRSHVTKEMFLAAVARPNQERGFDGKVGLYPVVEEYCAKRNSVNHRAGDVYFRPTTMTAKLFRRMLKWNVIEDAIRMTGSWAKEIIIQMDNAGGHGGGRGDLEKLPWRRCASSSRNTKTGLPHSVQKGMNLLP